MATASPFLSEDQFPCSICLDVFTEPVSLPCGHNFCNSCITRNWEGKEQCKCPLCNEKYSKGLKLCVNTEFREVVENFKKHVTADTNSPVKPGQVPCDCCPANKVKASKTCLVCLTSYCETHLEPHQRVAALKRHKLTDPVHNLEDKICKKHNRMFELFCRNDQTCVCALCIEHSFHDTIPLEEAYVDKSTQMVKQNVVQEVQQIKLKRGKKAKKTKGTGQTKRTGKDEGIVESNLMQAPHIWFHNKVLLPFLSYCFLPECMGISAGRFYYEVETKGEAGWFLGIVRESVLQMTAFTANPKGGTWILKSDENTNCQALHNVPIDLSWPRKLERIMVFVDYSNGLVSFYDAHTAMLIYTFTGCKFKERVFLFYGRIEKVNWVQRIQRKVQEIKAQLLVTILLGLILIFFLSLYLFAIEQGLTTHQPLQGHSLNRFR